MLSKTKRLDTAGIWLSIACALHCAILPLMITLLPLLGLKFLDNEYLEAGIIVSSIIIGYTSLTASCRRHRHIKPLVILTAGFGVMICGKLLIGHPYEWLFLSLGGLLVATAHFYNIRLNGHR